MIWLILMGVFGVAAYLELRTVPKGTTSEMRERGMLLLSHKRVVAVVAHPDDSEYWIAGTLGMLADKGARVVLVVASDGERGRDLTGSPNIAVTRRAEQLAAGSVMGYTEVEFLGHPDRAAADGDGIGDTIEAIISEENPDLVITFDGWKPQLPYLHPDHEAIGRLTVRRLNEIGYSGSLYLFHTRRPDTEVDITPVAARKVEAMKEHVSQNGGRTMRRRTSELFRRLQP
ncbi:MAG: PIG-L deacetylase family protein [Fimbriimonadales bacterium]